MNSNNRTKILLLLVGLSVLGGCASGPSTVTRSNFIEFTPEQKTEIEESGTEYRIQEGDKLKVAFNYQKELNQNDIVVLNDGSISLVGVDRIVVAGLTLTDADTVITSAYSKDYLDPNLSVIVQESQGRRVYVLGEVKNPGMHQLPAGGIDMLGAISVAGGFTDHAAKVGAVLVRVTNEGYLVQEIDLSDITALGVAMVDVQPLDVIYVPRSRIGDFAYFSRSVLAGFVQITRIASDLKYLSTGAGVVRF